MNNFKKKTPIKIILSLHAAFLLYVGNGVLLKFASYEKFMSWPFILAYGFSIFLLMVYALIWQQILKRMPLTIAYANRSVVIIWSVIASALIWNDKITWVMLIGIICIICGIYLVVNKY